MPGDTPVFAARDGVVLYLQDGFTEGGTDPRYVERANLVVIAHRDGTMVGDLLGWSGRTGYAGQPHLHFHVGVRLLGEPGRTVPVQLDDGRGRPLELREGVMIEPARSGPVRSYF
jgi:murein DD-endopeptidase MepM/ murein hydrolase activator NlpD